MKKENRWRVLSLILVPLIVTGSISPLISCKQKKLYHFEGHTFNSVNELIQYAESKLVKEIEIVNQQEVLNSALDPEKSDRHLVDSFHRFQDQLNSRIQKTEVDQNNLVPIQVDNNLKAAKIKDLLPADRLVYRSIDSQTLLEDGDKLKGEKSYGCLKSQKEGVFYRNRFYDDQEELGKAIKKDASLGGKYVRVYSNDINDTLRLYSPPIFLEQNDAGELKNEESIKPILENFLETSLNVVYEVNTGGQKKYYSDINEAIKQVRWTRDEYLHLPKNNARSAYVFDIKKNTQHDYYGPYASSDEIGIKQIQNQQLWHAIPNSRNPLPNLELQKENALVCEFFNLLIPDINVNPHSLFNITCLEEISNDYRNYMLKNAPEIWQKALTISEQLNRGQRKSILLKLPVMYTFISEEIAQRGLNQDCVVQTNRYFAKILDLLNQIIQTVFPKIILQKASDTKVTETPFNLLSLFEKTDLNEDNYLVSYRLDVGRIKKDYPYFLDAVKVALLAMENNIGLNGHFPYERTVISSVLKVTESSFEKLEIVFRKIWKLFSSKNFKEFMSYLTLAPTGLTKEQIPTCLVDHILLMNALGNAFEQEYQLQSKKVLANPASANSTFFFENLPNARELITTAGGDYGVYFLLRRKPELVARIRHGIRPTRQELASLGTAKSFFDLITSAFEIGQKIKPSIESFTSLIKKLAVMTDLPSLQRLASEFIKKFEDLNSKLNKSISASFCNVNNVVSGLVNLICDVWNVRPEPVDKTVYHFLNSDYFIDNNRFYLQTKHAGHVNYNEQFLKQLLPPIKITNPREVSSIYLNNRTYSLSEEGWNLANYEGLHRALFNDQHAVANVNIYYSFSGSTKIVDSLNSTALSVAELVNQSKLYPSRRSVYEELINRFKQVISDAPSVQTSENIVYLADYENNLLDEEGNFKNWEYLVLLPTVDEYGYLSFCPLQKIDFKVSESNHPSLSGLRYFTFFKRSPQLRVNNEANPISNNFQNHNYLLWKLLQEHQPAVKKITKNVHRDKIDESNKILAVDFDSLENENLKTVFKVWDSKNQSDIYFFDQHDAVDYLIKNSRVQKKAKTDYKVHLVYDRRKTFKDLTSFHQWVKSEMTTT